MTGPTPPIDTNIREALEDARLWCLHAIGPDDVYPAPDFETAQRWADWANDRFAGSSDVLRHVVATWPWDADSHAAGLADAIRDWTPPTPSATPASGDPEPSSSQSEQSYNAGAGPAPGLDANGDGFGHVREVIDFLLGEKALDGCWFGETYDDRPLYWWRARLRKALAALSQPQTIDAGEDACNVTKGLRDAKCICERVREESQHTDITTADYRHGFAAGAGGCVILIHEEINRVGRLFPDASASPRSDVGG